jgi:hypothetical protein
MANVHMLSINLAKRTFQVCATHRAGSVLYNRTISRSNLDTLFKEQASAIVTMEFAVLWRRRAPFSQTICTIERAIIG